MRGGTPLVEVAEAERLADLLAVAPVIALLLALSDAPAKTTDAPNQTPP
jgi:hypothetical protein